jgi:carbamoyltransferase
MTQRIGLKPNEDEYILMGWAALGDPNKYKKRIYDDFFKPLKPGNASVRFRENLHRGCLNWAPELNTPQDYADIAASTQAVYEHVFKHLIKETKRLVKSDNLVVMGGCALNCVANSIAHREYNGNVWIMPNPGDAGSSLGAVLAYQQDFIEWTGPYQGYNIAGDYPVNSTLKQLQSTGLVGVANGKAEFGPRALGNRSLFADPRGTDVKDRVNTVKRRQEFRPFAPVILEADASDYFDGPVGPYMQYTSVCKQPELFPAIAHYDNTSRVQTVNQKEHPGLFKLLTEWKKRTGCPMLLNTSLNIKGEPMVDTEADAERWQEQYNVPVFTKEDKQ